MVGLRGSPHPRYARLHLLLGAVGATLVVLAFLTFRSVNDYVNTILTICASRDTTLLQTPKLPAITNLFSSSQSQPLAVIVESHTPTNLVPLILHFSTVLGPDWSVVLFTLESTWHTPSSLAFRRALKSNRVQIRFLPPSTVLSNNGAANAFIASPWLWEQVQSAPRVLLFQTDSILCSETDLSVETYFEYDFVGAPIHAQYGEGFNGGLSLRNPRLFLEIARTGFKESGVEFEDQWFYKEAMKRGATLPSVEIAATFAVETVYSERPLGYHQPQRWQQDNLARIEEWCPEVKLLIGRRL